MLVLLVNSLILLENEICFRVLKSNEKENKENKLTEKQTKEAAKNLFHLAEFQAKNVTDAQIVSLCSMFLFIFLTNDLVH